MVKLYGTRICPLFLAVAVLPSCQRGEPVNNNKSDTEIEQALIITIPLSDGADGHSAERIPGGGRGGFVTALNRVQRNDLATRQCRTIGRMRSYNGAKARIAY